MLTNSVPVAMELPAREGIDLMLAGGQVRLGDAACSGAHAEAFFSEFYADKAFLGSGGVHPEAGLTDHYPAEDHRAFGHAVRAGRLEQARCDRPAPGLPA